MENSSWILEIWRDYVNKALEHNGLELLGVVYVSDERIFVLENEEMADADAEEIKRRIFPPIIEVSESEIRFDLSHYSFYSENVFLDRWLLIIDNLKGSRGTKVDWDNYGTLFCVKNQKERIDFIKSIYPIWKPIDSIRKILVVGHMSPESSHEYQRIMCADFKKRLGGDNSPEFIFLGLNFEEVRGYLKKNDIKGLRSFLLKKMLPFKGMVDGVMICTNTVHIIVPWLEEMLGVPFVHIADCAGKNAVARGYHKVALLGTKRTMSESFYKDRLAAAGGLEVVIPCENDQDYIDDVIHTRLCHGIITEEDRKIFAKIIEDLHKEDAEAVILGCTEIPLLIKDGDVCIPVIDTLALHAQAAVDFMLD